MSELARYASPVKGPQGLAWDGAAMWLTSAASGCLYMLDPETLTIRREFVPPFPALGITHAASGFRLILAPAIDESDLDLDHRYVYAFSPDAGFSKCFVCPRGSGSFLAYRSGTVYLSQAWDKKLIELSETGIALREVQLSRRPVGMTIVGAHFYLATVDEEWGDGRLDRLGIDADASSIESVRSFPFAPRSVAFDGDKFWSADRNNHALVSFTIAGVAS